MLNSSPQLLISAIITLLVSFTVHEFAHAWMATRFGDDTPRLYGRLTLNPLSHLDLMGSLMLLFVGFGWAKPVPVNPYALQRSSTSARMWVSLTGPLSNLVLAVVASIPFWFRLIPFAYPSHSLLPTPFSFLIEFIVINLSLMLFNLIPISPLDGKEVLDYFLPENLSRRLDAIQPFGPVILLVLVFLLPNLGINVLSWIMTPALSGMLKILLGGVL